MSASPARQARRARRLAPAALPRRRARLAPHPLAPELDEYGTPVRRERLGTSAAEVLRTLRGL